jgi:predicted ATP-dependent Lon-type protease
MADRFDNMDGTGMALGVTALLAAAGVWSQGGVGVGSMASGAARVAEGWAYGNHERAGNYFTDGDNLYSYALLIGYTDEDGNKVLKDYSASGEFRSATTSKHVKAAWPFADRIEDPSVRGLLD